MGTAKFVFQIIFSLIICNSQIVAYFSKEVKNNCDSYYTDLYTAAKHVLQR